MWARCASGVTRSRSEAASNDCDIGWPTLMPAAPAPGRGQEYAVTAQPAPGRQRSMAFV